MKPRCSALAPGLFDALLLCTPAQGAGLLGYIDALSGGSISKVGVFSLGERGASLLAGRPASLYAARAACTAGQELGSGMPCSHLSAPCAVPRRAAPRRCRHCAVHQRLHPAPAAGDRLPLAEEAAARGGPAGALRLRDVYKEAWGPACHNAFKVLAEACCRWGAALQAGRQAFRPPACPLCAVSSVSVPPTAGPCAVHGLPEAGGAGLCSGTGEWRGRPAVPAPPSQRGGPLHAGAALFSPSPPVFLPSPSLRMLREEGGCRGPVRPARANLAPSPRAALRRRWGS